MTVREDCTMDELMLRVRSLTDREMDVLRVLATGQRTRDMARELRVKECTVKAHLRIIFEKLGCATRTEAAIVALIAGLAS